jgi:hypothetical protein
MKPTPINAFTCGLLFMTGFLMFVQDFMGMEGYITYLVQHWVDLSPAWGASLCLYAFWGIVKMHISYTRAKHGGKHVSH